MALTFDLSVGVPFDNEGTTFDQADTNVLNIIGLPSGEVFGSLALAQTLQGIGIVSAEAFGAALLPYFIKPFGIPSEEVLGELLVQYAWLYPLGIISEETFGNVQAQAQWEQVAGVSDLWVEAGAAGPLIWTASSPINTNWS